MFAFAFPLAVGVIFVHTAAQLPGLDAYDGLTQLVFLPYAVLLSVRAILSLRDLEREWHTEVHELQAVSLMIGFIGTQQILNDPQFVGGWSYVEFLYQYGTTCVLFFIVFFGTRVIYPLMGVVIPAIAIGMAVGAFGTLYFMYNNLRNYITALPFWPLPETEDDTEVPSTLTETTTP